MHEDTAYNNICISELYWRCIMINLGGRLKPYCGLSINRTEDLREEILKEKKKSLCESIWVVHLYYMEFYKRKL